MEAELAVAALLAMIEESAGFRYTPDRRDQREPSDVSTYVTTTVISCESNYQLIGNPELDHTRVQINIFAINKRNGIVVMRAIRNHLQGFRGEVSIDDYPDEDGQPRQLGKVFVSDCSPAGARTLYSPAGDGSESGDYTIAVDYILSTTSGI
jgi:hypothetical protein